MYYIIYQIVGFDGFQKAGPYSWVMADYQFRDIAGFEGVFNVKMVPAEQIDNTNK